jgi:hypothetical protein
VREDRGGFAVKQGEYVLGMTGGTGDPWAVGFYGGKREDEHLVTHSDGRRIQGRTYRKVRRITHERGAWLLANAYDIEQSGRGWGTILRMPMEDLP